MLESSIISWNSGVKDQLEDENAIGETIDVSGQQGTEWTRPAKGGESWRTPAEGSFKQWENTA